MPATVFLQFDMNGLSALRIFLHPNVDEHPGYLCVADADNPFLQTAEITIDDGTYNVAIWEDGGSFQLGSGWVKIVDGAECEVVRARQLLVAAGLTVVPLTGVVQARTAGTTITVFTAETVTVSVAVVDATGTSVDVSAMTLTLIIERMTGVDISVVADASITKAGSTFSFAVPPAVSTNEGLYKWTLRQAAGNARVMGGVLSVEYAPQVDVA